MTKPEWEDVCSPEEGDYTERLRISGGWLYRTYMSALTDTDERLAIALIFVPDPPENLAQAELEHLAAEQPP